MSRLTEKLNNRHKIILDLLEEFSELSASALTEKLDDDKSAKTIVRDLNLLQELGYIVRKGKAKATVYSLVANYALNKEIDLDDYFDLEPDQREIKTNFDLNIFSNLKASCQNLLTENEASHIQALTESYQKNRKDLSKTLINKEIERLTIELAWKSSKIEGNTYSLLDTETLLKTGIVSPKHSAEEAQMLLNHKQALNYIVDNSKEFQELSVKKLSEIHSLLVDNLNVEKKIRTHLVSITGTKYRPLDNEFQIKEALEHSCDLVNFVEHPFIKALYSSALLSYIQAFEDGNKRTSRMTSNAILIAHGYCPLSYRSVDIAEYKKAILIFYEQNNIKYLKEILIDQYEFAVNNYFSA